MNDTIDEEANRIETYKQCDKVVIDEEANKIEPYKQRIIKLINEELYGGTKIRLTTSLEIVSTRCELIQWINDNMRIFFKISHSLLEKMINELCQEPSGYP
jgi:hypothetical protein